LLADELQCSVETIKKHVAHILERAGVDNRHALAGRRYDL
jgi:DNA-binding CsgD family transcriptional regulator